MINTEEMTMDLPATKDDAGGTRAVDIGTLVPDEWALFRDLRLHALQEDPAAFHSSFDEESDLSEEQWRGRLEDPERIYGVMAAGKLIGVSGVRFETSAPFHHIANILGMFVEPEYRRHGLAKKIMGHTLADLRLHPVITKVRLGVAADKDAAIALYKKFGFQQTGVFSHEIHVGGIYYDEVQMEMLFTDKM